MMGLQFYATPLHFNPPCSCHPPPEIVNNSRGCPAPSLRAICTNYYGMTYLFATANCSLCSPSLQCSPLLLSGQKPLILWHQITYKSSSWTDKIIIVGICEQKWELLGLHLLIESERPQYFNQLSLPLCPLPPLPCDGHPRMEPSHLRLVNHLTEGDEEDSRRPKKGLLSI